jgi:Na+/H+ antiporter NhaD/arsenite permease-like protein
MPDMHWLDPKTVSLVVFVITYTGIIFTRLPWVNIDRPSAAFFGAVSMLLFGVLTLEEAVRAIDFTTIFLLLGMMIIIATLQIDGFFSLIATKSIAFSGNNRNLLVFVVFVTGIASAFLVNDAVVLIFTPIIVLICRHSSLDPIPFLAAEILASNIGSAMTITGNPQNMLIGINSGISYGRFMLHLLPVSLLGMAVIVPVVRCVYRGEFREKKILNAVPEELTYDYSSMRVSVPVFGGVIVLFFLGKLLRLSIPVISLAGASVIMLLGRVKPSLIIQKVDWVLLLFFSSLFIVVAGIEKTGLTEEWIPAGILAEDVRSIGLLHASSLILSQIVSNVPYTVLMLPLLNRSHHEILWLALASASTLAGNATLIGAMANLIVARTASTLGVRITFVEFLKTGLLTTLLSFAISLVVLYLYLTI